MWNFLGAIASLLPGYMQGRRQAIQDNWTDLSNYNQVQAGQLNNAWTEGTWNYRMNMMRDADTNSGLQTTNNVWNTFLNGRQMPGKIAEIDAYNWYAPWQAMLNQQNNILAHQMMQQRPGLMFSAMGQNALNPMPSLGGQYNG